MFISQVALTLVVAAVSASAATSSSAAPTTTSGISGCIIGCTTSSLAAGNCTAVTDLQCICTSTAFQTAAATCLKSKCTAVEQKAALALQKQECASLSNSSSSAGSSAASSTATTGGATTSSASATGSLTGVAASLASIASSVASSAAASASPSSSGAAGAKAPIMIVSTVGVTLSVIGVLVGAMSVL